MKKLKWYHWTLLALWLGGLIWLEVSVYLKQDELVRDHRGLMVIILFAFLFIFWIGSELFNAPTVDDKYMDI